MRRMLVGLAAMLTVSAAGPVLAEDMTEEIQEEEQPGSEIEIEGGGGGGVEIERKSGKPIMDIGGGGAPGCAERPRHAGRGRSHRRRTAGRRAGGPLRS